MEDGPRQVAQALGEIERRLGQPLDVQHLAAGSWYARHHFQWLFAAVVGTPLMAYVRGRRLAEAGRALAEGGQSVTHVALRYGYESHAGFTRAYRAWHGLTPAQSRRYGLYRPFPPATIALEDETMEQYTNEKTRRDTAALT